MSTSIPYIGEFFAHTAAVGWAFAVILFKKSGETVHPVALNLFKNVLAIVLFVPTIWLFGETLFRQVPASEYGLLLLSGALGIGISDTLFFMCLNMLGAGLTAIVDCLYSPFIIGLSILWLGEKLSALQLVGVLLVISAVLTATYEGEHAGNISRRNLILGVLYGVLAMATMAVSIVMIKPLLNRSPILWVTEIRLYGGIITLTLVLLLYPARQRILRSLVSSRRWRYTLSGSFMGMYVSMIFWIAGMKFTEASIAAALNQTSIIFIYVFAVLFLRELMNVRRTLGIALAVCGAFLVTFG